MNSLATASLGPIPLFDLPPWAIICMNLYCLADVAGITNTYMVDLLELDVDST